MLALVKMLILQASFELGKPIWLRCCGPLPMVVLPAVALPAFLCCAPLFIWLQLSTSFA
jgi:hypothetical protein